MKSVTSCPSFANAFGSEPQTSPSPPVLAIGETSAVAKTTRIFAHSIPSERSERGINARTATHLLLAPHVGCPRGDSADPLLRSGLRNDQRAHYGRICHGRPKWHATRGASVDPSLRSGLGNENRRVPHNVRIIAVDVAGGRMLDEAGMRRAELLRRDQHGR